MLRRRTGKDDPPTSSDDKSRFIRDKKEEERLRAEFDGAEVKQLVIKPRSKRRNGFIFVLGGLFGVFIALFFANQQEVINLDGLMDLNIDSLIDVIPQGIVRDAREFSVCSGEGFLGALGLGSRLFQPADYEGRCGSNTNATPSIMIPSPLDYTFNHKAFRPNILL